MAPATAVQRCITSQTVAIGKLPLISQLVALGILTMYRCLTALDSYAAHLPLFGYSPKTRQPSPASLLMEGTNSRHMSATASQKWSRVRWPPPWFYQKSLSKIMPTGRKGPDRNGTDPRPKSFLKPPRQKGIAILIYNNMHSAMSTVRHLLRASNSSHG